MTSGLIRFRVLNIIVSGKVQGVSFRAATKAVADQLGVKGTIRNHHDGALHIKAAANHLQMDQFLEWCREGPDHARVESVKIEELEIDAAPIFKNFEILK